ncbi:C-type lectin domain family 4 member A-like [Elephas maximus indicus]|uniref:C-type lectin domain family 4 member A-like n=1 Tax=Elephas maximus indicus TaxID=99487 RepID=UPI002115D675|nr:C-type lectin domain family 4 member A-like [Elephas maximus indicus]
MLNHPYTLDILGKGGNKFSEESKRPLLNMASELTYAEMKFKNESNTSGSNSEPPAAPKEKTSPRQSNPGFPKQLLASLLTHLLLLAISSFIAFISKYAA